MANFLYQPQGLKYECTSDWSGALINQSPPQVKWHLLRRLSSSSMKMFTTITEFIADERSHQTGTTSVSSVQYRCSAIDSVTQSATEILRTSYTYCNFCKMQRTTTLARDRCSCRNYRRYFTTFINTWTLLQSYICILNFNNFSRLASTFKHIFFPNYFLKYTSVHISF